MDVHIIFISPDEDDSRSDNVGVDTAPPRPLNELFVSIRVIRPNVFALRRTSQTAHSSSATKFDIESMTFMIELKRALRMGALPSNRRFYNDKKEQRQIMCVQA